MSGALGEIIIQGESRVVPSTYSVSSFYCLYYLLGVYFRCLLCVLLLSVEIEVSTFCGPYYLLGVYFPYLYTLTVCVLDPGPRRHRRGDTKPDLGEGGGD